MLVRWILLSLIILKGFKSEIIKPPKNSAVVTGQQVTLECSITGHEQMWSEEYNIGTISNDDNVLDPYKGIYGIEGGVRNFNLILLSAKYDYAGRHVCDDIFENVESGAEIIVLGTDPMCTANSSQTNHVLLEGESIHYVCTVEYKGKWGPRMDWVASNGRGISPDYKTEDNADATQVQYSYSTIVDRLDEGLSIRVLTTFDPPSSSGEGSASNAPNYVNIWDSPKITVQYPPESLHFDHCNNTMCLNINDSASEVIVQQWDFIRANAASNPPIDYYMWFNDGVKLTEGSNENEFVFNDNGTFTIGCIIRSTMRGGTPKHVHRNILVFVDVGPLTTQMPSLPPNELGPGAIAGIVIACLLVSALVSMVLFFVYKHQGRETEKDGSLCTNDISHYSYPELPARNLQTKRGSCKPNSVHQGVPDIRALQLPRSGNDGYLYPYVLRCSPITTTNTNTYDHLS